MPHLSGIVVPDQEFQYVCGLCERRVPRVTSHHLVPKSRGGKETVDACPDCHGMIHAVFENKHLAASLNTVDDLKADSEFASYLKWIKKRPADRRYRAKRSRTTRNRGRGG